MRLAKLPRSFYLRPTLTIAPDLLGKYLVRKNGSELLIGKIVEVEAYLGERDPASHAYRGKTKRNEVMFMKGGHLYVYFTYGMHYCCNVVTEKKGMGCAVLLRALEPIQGLKTMLRLRGTKAPPKYPERLSSGPANLCRALGIGGSENGTDLLGKEIFIAEGEQIPRSRIAATPRIGIRNAVEKRWRFHIRENRFVSG
jgi:DNA-3-methyladenine glycosylase